MKFKNYKYELITGFILLAVVIITIVYGEMLETKGIAVRRWHWNNLLLILPVVPLLFLQQTASLPGVLAVHQKKYGWLSTFGVGIMFGLLDVLVIKCILHPEPYRELPPFLQPFPYSMPLYTSGALEIELYYRMIPLTVFLLLDKFLFKLKHRTVILIFLAVVTSVIEPIQQFPQGAWWLIVYAAVSSIAMNAWQFRSYLQYGFLASLAVRLGHYFIWHILLGIYVQYVELM
jgi:hypothetical protein